MSTLLDTLREPLDREGIDAMTVEFVPLVVYLVDRFIREGGGRKAHLRDDLISEGNLALVKAVHSFTLRTEPTENLEHLKNFVCLSIKGTIANYALKPPRGFSATTAARRKAEGIDDVCPSTQTMTHHVEVLDPHDDQAVFELMDSINHACLDVIDREIVRLKMDGGFSNEDCARHFCLPISRIKSRLAAIFRRMDHA